MVNIKVRANFCAVSIKWQMIRKFKIKPMCQSFFIYKISFHLGKIIILSFILYFTKKTIKFLEKWNFDSTLEGLSQFFI